MPLSKQKTYANGHKHNTSHEVILSVIPALVLPFSCIYMEVRSLKKVVVLNKKQSSLV